MFESILNGKISKEIAHKEDVLTSEIFGLIQFLPVNVFWESVLLECVNLRKEHLLGFLHRNDIKPEQWIAASYNFWPRTNKWGEPDILIEFSDEQSSPFYLVLEVKKDSFRHGQNDKDQLLRYLSYLEKEKASKLPVLIYLTPRISTQEIIESVRNNPKWECNIFEISWQKVYQIIEHLKGLEFLYDIMCLKILRILEYENYMPFNGFRWVDDVKLVSRFYRTSFNNIELFITHFKEKELGGFYGV
jgi:hypothetical protein